MNNETLTILISLITAVLTFVGTVYATTLQNRRNRDEIAIEHEKTRVQQRIDQDRLEQEVEATLWKRVQAEIDRLNQELATERVKRRDLEARIAKLINENAKLSGTVDGLSKDNQRLEAENTALRQRIQELERRMGTGPLTTNKVVP